MITAENYKPVYRVKDWEEHFENNRTKAMKEMRWIPVPNTHDGDGYTSLIDHENGASYLGCWLAILQVASKCHPRGTLLRDNAKPHDSASISRITRLPKVIIEETIERLCSDDVSWLQVVDSKVVASGCQEGAGSTSGSCAEVTMEGNGIEGNGIDKHDLDLFEKCWAEYGRVGSKKKAKEYWQKLSHENRLLVAEKIPSYNKCVAAGRMKKDFQGWINPKNMLFDCDWDVALREWDRTSQTKKNPTSNIRTVN